MFRPPLAGRVTPPAPFPEYMTAALWFSRISLWVYFYRRVLQRTQSRAISSEMREFVSACRRWQDSLGLWDSALGSSPRVDASGTSPTSSFAAGNIYKSLSNHITSFSSVSSPNIISAKFVSSRLSLPAPGGSSVAMLDCLPSDMAGFYNSIDNVLKPLSLQPGCQCKAVSL